MLQNGFVWRQDTFSQYPENVEKGVVEIQKQHKFKAHETVTEFVFQTSSEGKAT